MILAKLLLAFAQEISLAKKKKFECRIMCESMQSLYMFIQCSTSRELVNGISLYFLSNTLCSPRLIGNSQQELNNNRPVKRILAMMVQS